MTQAHRNQRMFFIYNVYYRKKGIFYTVQESNQIKSSLFS